LRSAGFQKIAKIATRRGSIDTFLDFLRFDSGTTLATPAAVNRSLRERSFELSKLVLKLYPALAASGPEMAIVARELLRSVASIGANLEEGAAPSSRRDMAARHAIALRESREAHYWSRLGATDPRHSVRLAPVVQETGEFVAMLTVSVRKLRTVVVTSLVIIIAALLLSSRL
jgi:four helix bundle protein